MTLLMASCIAAASPVEAAPVTRADVTATSAKSDILFKLAGRSPAPLVVPTSLQTKDRPEVTVPAGSRAWADLLARPTNLSARLSGSASRTRWTLPCNFSGSGFLSWSVEGRRGCAPPGVVIQAAAGRGATASTARPWNGPWIASRTGTGETQPSHIRLALRAEALFASCSATDGDGQHARTAVSLSPLGFLFGDGDSLCDRAVNDCEVATGGPGSCGVVSEVSPGQWRQDAVAYSICDGQLRRFSSTDALLSLVPGLQGQTMACSVLVLGRGDVLLRPQDGQIAAVAFEKNAQGALVSVLQGSVEVVSREAAQWTPVAMGMTFQAGSAEIIPMMSWLRDSQLCRSDDDEDDQLSDQQGTSYAIARLNSGTPLAMSELARSWAAACSFAERGLGRVERQQLR